MTYRGDLMCEVVSLTYDFENRVGTLVMEENNCCDMRACIALFELIDSGVQRINTFAGGERDTMYVKRRDEWIAKP